MKKAIKRDLTGMRFTRLLVIKDSGKRRRRQIMWECLCDCGIVKNVERNALLRNTKSCGCLHKEINSILFRKEKGESGFNELYWTYKYAANKRKLGFNISKEEFKGLTSQNCIYCGVAPHKVFSCGKNIEHSSYIYNGIDRVENSIGYHMDNVVPCCIICNRAKHNLSLEEFQEWLYRVSNNYSIM